jgi:hypothetical protein
MKTYKAKKYGAAGIIFGLIAKIARSFIGRLIEGPPRGNKWH